MGVIYSVRQPIMPATDPQCWNTSREISRHRTPLNAVLKIRDDTNALQQQPGHSTAFLDWHVCVSTDGGQSWSLWTDPTNDEE